MKKKKSKRGIESLKSKYGLMFVSPWIIGFIIFFAIPLFQSVIYSFSKVLITENGIVKEFIGLKNFRFILLEDPEYTNNLSSSLTQFFTSLPFILLISLVLALLLNQKFRGRLFFRALYFMPVIIATGTVITILFKTTSSDITDSTVSDSLTGSMFSIEDLIRWLDLPDAISKYVSKIMNDILDLIWSSGIQTVLFIAGLQSIPSSLYEVSKVEGATKWEEFWFITFPMLHRVTLLVAVFTMVELIVSNSMPVVSKAFSMMISGNYDETSAMLWLYFLVVGAIMAGLVLLYNKLLVKRWT